MEGIENSSKANIDPGSNVSENVNTVEGDPPEALGATPVVALSTQEADVTPSEEKNQSQPKESSTMVAAVPSVESPAAVPTSVEVVSTNTVVLVEEENKRGSPQKVAEPPVQSLHLSTTAETSAVAETIVVSPQRMLPDESDLRTPPAVRLVDKISRLSPNTIRAIDDCVRDCGDEGFLEEGIQQYTGVYGDWEHDFADYEYNSLSREEFDPFGEDEAAEEPTFLNVNKEVSDSGSDIIVLEKSPPPAKKPFKSVRKVLKKKRTRQTEEEELQEPIKKAVAVKKGKKRAVEDVTDDEDGEGKKKKPRLMFGKKLTPASVGERVRPGPDRQIMFRKKLPATSCREAGPSGICHQTRPSRLSVQADPSPLSQQQQQSQRLSLLLEEQRSNMLAMMEAMNTSLDQFKDMMQHGTPDEASFGDAGSEQLKARKKKETVKNENKMTTAEAFMAACSAGDVVNPRRSRLRQAAVRPPPVNPLRPHALSDELLERFLQGHETVEQQNLALRQLELVALANGLDQSVVALLALRMIGEEWDYTILIRIAKKMYGHPKEKILDPKIVYHKHPASIGDKLKNASIAKLLYKIKFPWPNRQFDGSCRLEVHEDHYGDVDERFLDLQPLVLSRERLRQQHERYHNGDQETSPMEGDVLFVDSDSLHSRFAAAGFVLGSQDCPLCRNLIARSAPHLLTVVLTILNMVLAFVSKQSAVDAAPRLPTER